ncbi:hypothetical protein CHELA1G11_12233 [Hyphomicrobiales bacterium]|nr:hypothetical protein CHELA1G2_12079 [Hyphomicrobiales bacterium]CAH1663410.1 hypothetical protein CHELA1G11_12233 [Hyphomicrobiales bacterium]
MLFAAATWRKQRAISRANVNSRRAVVSTTVTQDRIEGCRGAEAIHGTPNKRGSDVAAAKDIVFMFAAQQYLFPGFHGSARAAPHVRLHFPDIDRGRDSAKFQT